MIDEENQQAKPRDTPFEHLAERAIGNPGALDEHVRRKFSLDSRGFFALAIVTASL